VDAYQTKDKSHHETMWDDLMSSNEDIVDEGNNIQ